MSDKPLRTALVRLDACREAVEWVGDRDLATAWAECPRGDWMLWLAGKTADRKLVVRAAVAVARSVLHLVPAGEDRPWYATEVALAWCDGRATLAEGRAAACAAYNAAYAADAAAYAACAAAARATSLARSTDIVRDIIKWEDLHV